VNGGGVARVQLPKAYLAIPRTQAGRHLKSLNASAVPHLVMQSNHVRETTLIDARLMASKAHAPEPTAIWWDVTMCDSFLDCSLEAFVFPVLALKVWHHLRQPAGAVAINARLLPAFFGKNKSSAVLIPAVSGDGYAGGVPKWAA
jgi:hypothetical protein